MTSLLGKVLQRITPNAEEHINTLNQQAIALLKQQKIEQRSTTDSKKESRAEKKARLEAELQIIRENKARPTLRKEFEKQSNAIARSAADTAPYIEAIEHMLQILRHKNSPFTVERRDDDKASAILDFMAEHENLILRGNYRLPPQDFSKLNAEYKKKTGLDIPLISSSLRGDDAAKTLAGLIQRPKTAFLISLKPVQKTDGKISAAKEICRVNIRGWKDKDKPTIHVTGPHGKTIYKASTLSERNLSQALDILSNQILECSPAYQQTYLTALKDLQSSIKETSPKNTTKTPLSRSPKVGFPD